MSMDCGEKPAVTKSPVRDNPLLTAALRYAQMGWAVLPCRPRGKQPLVKNGVKDATTDPEVIRRWWRQWPNANIGIATARSKLVVIDLDGDEGLRSWQALRSELGLPAADVPQVVTAKGCHLYFQANGTPIRPRVRNLPGVDVRAGNSYVVAPPSIHPSGRRYEWADYLSPWDIPLPPLPPALAERLNGKPGGNGRAEPLPERIPEGQRNAALTSLAGSLRRRGASYEAIRAALLTENRLRCAPPLPDDEIERIAKSVARYEPAENSAQSAPVVMGKFYPRPFALKVLERGQFLSIGENKRGGFYRYDPQRGIWRDDAEMFIEHVLRCDGILPDELKKRHVIDEIIDDVRGLVWREDGMPTPDVHLIPFRNGAYDLRTGQLRPLRPEDYFTFTLPWRYNPNAKSTFIAEKMANFPEHIQTHFWELLAYCLYRGYPFQRFFIWVGKKGRNGKTLLTNIIIHTLGEGNVAGVTLSELQNNRFAPAALFRKMANVAGEVSYDDLTNTDLLKKLCGGDWFQAEQKYRDPVPFKNYAKLIFLLNSLPKTRDTTDAFYRRTFIVQFEHQFEENPAVMNELELIAQDPRRAEEFEWVLAKAVATLQELMRRNFVFTGTIPVDQAKELYERLSNPLRQFIDENCEVTRSAEDFIFKFEFKERFAPWLAEHGHNAYTDNRLGREMGELGFESGQRGEAKWWAWLGLRWKKGDGQSQDSQDSHLFQNNFPGIPEKLFVETCDSCDSCDCDGPQCVVCGAPTPRPGLLCDRCRSDVGRYSFEIGDMVYLVSGDWTVRNTTPWPIEDIVALNGEEFAVFEARHMQWPLRWCLKRR